MTERMQSIIAYLSHTPGIGLPTHFIFSVAQAWQALFLGWRFRFALSISGVSVLAFPVATGVIGGAIE